LDQAIVGRRHVLLHAIDTLNDIDECSRHQCDDDREEKAQPKRTAAGVRRRFLRDGVLGSRPARRAEPIDPTAR
jgi:hypothetical protein